MSREESQPLHGEKAFRGAYIATQKLARSLGTPVPLTYEEDYTLEEQPNVDPATIVGTRTTKSGNRDGVTFEIVVDEYDESSGVDPTNNILFNIRINAAEGATAVPEEYDDDKGLISGLVWLHTDGTVYVDFGHGTQPSVDPAVQSRLLEIGAAFGFTDKQLYSDTPITLQTPEELTHFAVSIDHLAEDPSIL